MLSVKSVVPVFENHWPGLYSSIINNTLEINIIKGGYIMECVFGIDMNIKYQSYESYNYFLDFLNRLRDERVISTFSQNILDSEGYYRHYEICFILEDDCMNTALFKFIDKLKALRSNLVSSNNVAYILLMLLLNSASNSGGEAEASFKSKFTYGEAKMTKIGLKEVEMFYQAYITIKSSQSVINRIKSFLQNTIKYRAPKVVVDIDDSDEINTSITIYPGQLSNSDSYPIYFISEFLKDLKHVEDTLYWNMACDNMIKKFNTDNGSLNYKDSIIDIYSHISKTRFHTVNNRYVEGYPFSK